MPTKKTELQVSPEVVLWKKNKIKECRMEFSCGGDSMNDYSFKFYGDKGKEIECTELGDFFEDEVFRRVEFYEASDGHYIGEFGEVVITLNDDEDEFEYDKCSKSEWSETYSEEIPIGITPEEAKFIKEKVNNMNGGGDGEKNINYKIDCIVTDEEDEMIGNILDRINNTCDEHEFEDPAGEPEEFFRWSTNSNDNVIQIKGDNIIVSVTRSFLETREETY